MARGHQVSNTEVPAHMRKRATQSGPNVGFPVMHVVGPLNIDGADAARTIPVRLPGQGASENTSNKIRLIAVAWSCGAVSGAGPTFDCLTSVGGAGTSFIRRVGGTLSIDLNATPSGVAYFLNSIDASIAHLTKAIAAPITDPAVVHNGLRARVTGGGQTVTDLCLMFYYWPVSHINTDPLDD